MNKILVEIYLPATGCSYDVFIPLDSKLSEVILLLRRVLNELSNGSFIAQDDSILCDKETGSIFSINLSAHDLGLKDGASLILI